MMDKKTILAGSISLVLLCVLMCSSTKRFPVLRGSYLGQDLPGDKPVLFAPGMVSTGLYERDVAIAPDGNEMAFGLISGTFVVILISRRENGRWTKLEVAPFASDATFGHFEPHITPDGERMLFLTTRPPSGEDPKPGWFHQNIWAVDRIGEDSWGEPYDLGTPINTDDHEYYPSVTRDGSLYFTRSERSTGKTTLLRSTWNGDAYSEPEPVPDPVNGEGNIYNAFISPDETYLIACVEGRDELAPIGRPNYYIFFRRNDDVWSEAIHMGEPVNFPDARATSATVSPDGRFLFFGSSRLRSLETLGAENRYTIEIIQRIAQEPENGSSDIYWIRADFLQELRPEKF